jgi:hypothetical protein
MRYGALLGATLSAALAACASAGDTDLPVIVDALPPPPMVDAPPPPNEPPVDLCLATQTCQTAPPLGQVSGDTGSQRQMAMGYQSAWFRVRVTEDSSSATPMSVTAKLTSPAGVAFDVFIYLNANQDSVECSTIVGNKITSGTVKQTRDIWGDDGILGNGVSDSRDVTVEVRHVSGTCASGAMWQLEIIGNT